MSRPHKGMFLLTWPHRPYPWYFETDTAEDALAGRHLLERYWAITVKIKVTCTRPRWCSVRKLISNVIKHAPPVACACGSKQTAVVMRCAFTIPGRGFEEVYFQRTRPAAGSGLFYIVRRLCEPVFFWPPAGGDGFTVRADLPLTRRAAVRVASFSALSARPSTRSTDA